ncbi:MAG TPA: hypothetical protein VFR43_04555 [Gaiellaceae bacterium]|nr:hypothetical protein [Gaiellaceae bacterium]
MRPAATGSGRRLAASTLVALAALALAAPAYARDSLLDRLTGVVAGTVDGTLAAATAPVTEPVVAQTPAAVGETAPGPTGCAGEATHPFLRWLDPAAYVPAPGGDFERPSGWSLSGRAAVVAGNEPFRVGGRHDRFSLLLRDGAAATTPPVCVGLLHPTLRFFATGGSGRSWLRVEVVYRTLAGPASHVVAMLPPRARWAPTLPLPFLANAIGLTALDGPTTTVQFRFTATGGAPWQVDDVYVDPWKID